MLLKFLFENLKNNSPLFFINSTLSSLLYLRLIENGSLQIFSFKYSINFFEYQIFLLLGNLKNILKTIN